MFLKRLNIYNGDVPIREIPFHKGINLIVDETKSQNKTESGNSVGKTTVLRLIDFCLDGNGKNIYLDPEFRTTNKKIEQFLKSNNIRILLTLCKDLDDATSNEIEIERNFLKYKSKIQKVNGETLSNDDFPKVLKDLIFNSQSEKPTLKQLKSKNIRDERNKLIHTLKVLDSFTTDVEYELLFLFWLGIDTDCSKDKLVRDKNLEEKLQTRLRKESNLSQINQSLIIVNKEIADLNTKKEFFNLNDKYEEELQLLNLTKSHINQISTKLSRLELRKELILESKINLEKDYSDLDTEQIKRMYERAKSLIPNVQKTFEQTLSFHNEMIQQKISYITEELPKLEADINKERRHLKLQIIKEKTLSESLNKSGAIDDLQIIINGLNSYYEKKGNLEEQKRLWEKSNDNLKQIQSKLDTINKNILSKDELIQERITEFNKFFSDISSRLDGLHSLLSAENVDGVYKFKIGNIEGNPGTGSKKSQMASFDLAYIKFADSLGIPCLHFVLQDQIENVHSNQITNLLTEIVDEVNCQYILPVLRDKLPTDIDIEHFEILSLSQSDKLFKVE
ncbi:DUF2326 domain-containing protein [Draconibacterium sediminis]|uniref:DUF2326 domain-containing protein n=1 Tax=Draconibacterium sediminis TaxID=1544798 RepID=A0A0D8J6S3_9BACT|nr:DUF2326 domain-containing protein [Draconibacterium sediminis]KJF42675.1 hypothetical protein LH29_19270 [Draconibacterium sediminis]